MKRLDVHIGRSVLAGTGMVALVVGALVVLARLLREMGSFGWLQTLVYVALKTPSDMVVVLPVITLLGALLALGALADGRELVVLRCAGVSVLRLAAAVSMAGIVLAAITAGINEYLEPAGVDMANQIKRAAKGDANAQLLADEVWLRQGDDVVKIGGILPDQQVTDVTIYRLDDEGRLQAALHAPRARPDDAGLLLHKPHLTRIQVDRTTTEAPAQLHVDIRLDTDILQLAAVDPERQSSFGLWRYIRYLQANNVDTEDYQLALWQNLVSPFTVWLLTVFALPFAFGSQRSGGSGQRLFFGGLFGLVFYLVNEVVAASGVVYGLPPWLAASLPTLLLLIATGYWIRRLN